MAKGNAPLITSAGRDHIILSKQLAVIITIVVLCGAVLFFRMEQDAVERSFITSQNVTKQNSALRKRNSDLILVKKQLEEDEQDLQKMYEEWILDDNEDVKVTKEQIAEFQAKLDKVQESQDLKEAALKEKEDALHDKEEVLQQLHMRLREKNILMKQMKGKIKQLNGTIPTVVAEMPDDDDWAW